MKRVLVGLSISLGGILAALLLIEIAFRLFASGAEPGWNDRPRRYFSPEGAATLQDYIYAPVKPPGSFRIAVVGDSFSFAPYMQFDDAFPKRLERWLNLNSAQPKVEVLNYGVPRYSTSHEVKITERALEQGADLVLLQITLNDPEIKPYWPTGLLLDEETGEVKLDGALYRHWRSLAYVMTRLEYTRSHREYRDYYFKLFRRKDTLDNFTGSLQKIVDRCRERKVPLVAVVFPLFGYEVDENYPFHPLHRQVAELLKDRQVPALDVTESFRNLPLERLQVMPGADRHPNEIGHRIAAEEILGWLEREKLVPAEILPKHTVSLRVGLKDVPQKARPERPE